MTSPEVPRVQIDSDLDMSPGSPRWYLNRLVQKLMGRQPRLAKLERYALGNHPYPNGDKRYVAALGDLQKKSRTNYYELVIKAVVERMRVKEIRIGSEGQADEDARKIWNANDMDYQIPILLNTAATFGDVYVLVSPPEDEEDEEDTEPIITIEDPKMCITESDPRRRTKTLAGLRMWQDDIIGKIVCVLYLPNKTYIYHGNSMSDPVGQDIVSLLTRMTSTPDAGGFQLIEIQDNPYGKVPLFCGPWMPSFGSISRGEAEGCMDIQDRINHTILDRLVIAKNQAYNQRWVTGLHEANKSKGHREFNPGADRIWATYNENAKFGEFQTADLTQILEAIRDDVGDMAATSQTPATYLMNRMVNVSGDTLTQDQSALVSKVKLRFDAMGWLIEQVFRMCFLIKGDNTKAKEAEFQVMWLDPEIRTLAEQADALTKFVGGQIPLELAMQKLNFTDEEIKFAVEKAEEQEQKMLAQQESQMRLEASLNPKPNLSGKGVTSGTGKPKSGKPGSASGGKSGSK